MNVALRSTPMPVFPVFASRIYDDPDKRAAAAALPLVERQEIIRELVVKSPKFKRIVAHVERFHMPVKGGVHGRGVVGGILGPSRAGKSWAIQYYVKSLGTIRSATAIVPRALYVDVPEGMTGASFAAKIFREVGLGSMPRRSASWLLDQVADEIVEHGIELLVIDDAQFLINSKLHGTVQAFEGFVTALAEKRTCNILLSGTEGIEQAVMAFPHLQGRGGFPVHRVEPYTWPSTGETSEFVALMASIDQRLPFLLTSDLASFDIAAHLYKLSGGVIGLARNIIEDAANRALDARADRIGTDHLRAAAETRRRPNDPYQPFVSNLNSGNQLGSAPPPRAPTKAEDLMAAFVAAQAAETPTLNKRGRRSVVR